MRIFVRRAAYPRAGEQAEQRSSAAGRGGGVRPASDDDYGDREGDEQPKQPPVIGPADSRRQGREWGLVLQSAGIRHELRYLGRGWGLVVDPSDLERGWAAIRAYENENADWPPVRQRDRPRHAPSAAAPTAFVLLVLFYLMVTGPSAAGSHWFQQGTADSRLLTSEPWRMVTALTLHADAKHAVGNAISGSIFGAIVGRRLGPGAALLAIVAAGAIGNAANAVSHIVQADVHRSIGASTAVFGAVGILALLQVTLLRTERQTGGHRLLSILGPVIGGLALLGALGAAPHSDLWAHLYGFVAGAFIGLATGLGLRRRAERAVRWSWQLGLGATAAAAVAGSWALAWWA